MTATAARHWCIITCDYTPTGGGLGSHTFILARALAESGDTVEVWAPPDATSTPVAGVGLHVLPSRFGVGALRILRDTLRALSPDTRVLVQYVPSRFGWRGRNILFALLLFAQRHRGIDVYLHELGFPLSRRHSTRRNFTALTHLLMIWLVLRAARRVFAAAPGWQHKLTWLGVHPADAQRLVTWLPLPSALPEAVDAERVHIVRERLTVGARHIVGHYGSFGEYHLAVLPPAFERILDDGADRRVLLVGRRSSRLRDAIVTRRPDLASRVVATGSLSPAEVSVRLAVCDVLVQPFRDGVSVRHRSLVAALAQGRPVVTNRGPHTGSFWAHRRPVQLTDSERPADLADAVAALLYDERLRAELSVSARRLHAEFFSLERTISRLRKVDAEPPRVAERASPARVVMLHRPARRPTRADEETARAIGGLTTALTRRGLGVVVASSDEAAVAAADLLHVHARWLPLFTTLPTLHTVRSVPPASVRERIVQARSALERMRGRVSVRTRGGPVLTVAVSETIAARDAIDRVISDGVDHDVFAPGDKSASPRIFFRGEWAGRHGGRWLYELFIRDIVPHLPHAELVLVTDASVPPHPRVRMLVPRNESEIADACREAWVFACPVPEASGGTALLEAMASATVVLATNTPAAVEQLGNGRFGVLAEPGIYAGALLRLLHDAGMRDRVSTSAWVRSMDFSWERVADRYLELYDVMLQ